MRFLKKAVVIMLGAVLLLGLPATSKAAQPTDGISSSQPQKRGWQSVNGKQYYYDKKGVKVTGLKKINGAKYYFNKKGVMQTGLKKVKGKTYYFDKTYGYMVTIARYKNYLISYNGVCYKIPDKKTGNKKKDAQRVAKLIAKCVQKKGKGVKDIDRVSQAAFYVYTFCKRCKYTMKGTDYRQAYGVFIAKKYSCAGATRAMGMVLDYMGYKWKHVNANKYTHQWCQLKMDGKKGFADGQIGVAGYGKYM